MRLLYWFTHFLDGNGRPSRYHGIEQFEINLNTHTRYHFNAESRELSQEAFETPLPKGFWGNAPLYNLNVIVGDNGVGKTTVVHTMMDTLQELYDRNIKNNSETIILVEKNGSDPIIIHLTGTGNSKDIESKFTSYKFKPGRIKTEPEVLQIIDQTKVIYITNTLSQIDDERYKRTDNQPHVRANFIFDGSLCGTMRHNMEDDCYRNAQLDILNTFFTNEYYKQVKFVCDRTQYQYLSKLREKKLPVPVPKELYITMRFNDDDKLTHMFEEKFKNSELNKASDIIRYCLCALCFRTFLQNIHCNNIQFITENDIPNEISFDSFTNLFNKTVENVDKNHIQHCDVDNVKNQCIDFVSFLCDPKSPMESFIISEEDVSALKEGFHNTTMSISIEDEDKDFEGLINFMQLYRLTCVPYYYLDFSWGLSSGENNLLRLFSSLFYNFDFSGCRLYNWSGGKRRAECNSVLLFMDEADLTYHPEWQRQFVQILTAFLPLEFGTCELDDLQVVLTTHSPLLLGDIPSNNVTYLEKASPLNQHNVLSNTFGQNIHSILKDSFFLRNGTFGAFAVSKINSTAAKLREPEKLTADDMAECKALINLVSPGILKGKLMALYATAETKNGVKSIDAVKEYAEKLSTRDLTILIEVLTSEIKGRKE